MAIKKDTKDLLSKWGIDVDALVAAHTAAEEKDFSFSVTADTIKANFPDHSFMSTDDLNGLKGRVKSETLTQAEEIGIKALKEKAGLQFEGKDPAKFLEALGAHLKLPVDGKLQEKEKDIETLKGSIKEWKTKFEGLETQVRERAAIDSFAKMLPANKTKLLRDSEIMNRFKEDGYSIGEYDDNGNKVTALFKNGEVQKDKELKLIDPKGHIGEWMKSGGLLESEQAAGGGGPQRRTFDTGVTNTGGKSSFDHSSAYEKAIQAGGGVWNEKAQAAYTEMMVGQA